jgi:heat shock 70kDa protein 4
LKKEMSVVGIDFGNLNALIAQAGKGGVDLILNDASLRQTATCMSFQGKQRFFGDAAAALMRSNIRNTITIMKLLVGRNYDDEDVQLELSKTPFKHARLPNGSVGIAVEYNNDQIVLSAEHIMGMMLTKLKDIVSYANGVNIGDSVLAVPAWFTDSQRKGIMTACEIADLPCLKIANEGTCVALSYGIYKSAKGLFSETEPTHVMFIDIGYTNYTVTIVDFLLGKLQVLSSVVERNLGGRDFDEVIVEYFAEAFQKQTGIDVRKNAKAIKKLEAAAEKAKKTLSPAGVLVANVSVECLAEDRDLNCQLTLEEFETRSAPLVAKLTAPIEQALAEAGLDKSAISDVEIVGGSVRVNCLKKTLGAILGLDASAVNCGLRTTMNSDEAVARGAALQCAMESSRIKVKPFTVIDKVYYPVEVQYDADSSPVSSASEGKEDGMDVVDDCAPTSSAGGMSTIEIYSRGDDLPRKPRRLTFRNKTDSFAVRTAYSAGANLPPGQDRLIAVYTINIPDNYKSSPHDVRVTFNMDKNGCVGIAGAQLMEELPPVENPEPAEGKDSKETQPAEDSAPKKRFKKVELHIDTVSFGLTRQQIKDTVELEAQMANEDRLIIETADRRNELESYIYAMRDKLDGPLKDFATNSERVQFKELIDKTESWLYDDGFDRYALLLLLKSHFC